MVAARKLPLVISKEESAVRSTTKTSYLANRGLTSSQSAMGTPGGSYLTRRHGCGNHWDEGRAYAWRSPSRARLLSSRGRSFLARRRARRLLLVLLRLL